MKSKDLLLIGVVVLISVVIALVGSKLLFGSSATGNQQAEVVAPISTTFPQPDNRYFNSSAFDPTQNITITTNNNSDPFSGSSQQ